MTRVITTPADLGRACPYCRFPLKEGMAAECCDACRSLHHEDCWNDGGGCAVLGCPGAGTAVFAAAAPQAPGAALPYQQGPAGVQPQTAVQQGYGAPAAYGAPGGGAGSPGFGAPPGAAGPPGYGGPQGAGPPGYGAPPGYPQPPAPRPARGGVGTTTLMIAAVIAAAGIATGVLLAGGVLSSKSPPAPIKVMGNAHAPAPPTQISPAEAASRRRAIMGVLGVYQSAYSNHDITGLSSIFSPGIKRHGLAAGGCSVVQGRSQVLRDYASQFAQGTGTYTLVGLDANQIQLDSRVRAHVHANYEISSGGAGFVNFSFAELGGSWKISQVYATCA